VALISITLLALPCDFTHYFELVKAMNLNPVFTYGLKIILAFPVTYHFLNGIRHLVRT
jgi:succinate dehydrogenase (ubiquinone) cytochrome b560 subunit